MSYPKVLALEGGWNEWHKEGYPVEAKLSFNRLGRLLNRKDG
jgi:3-mercaptopyruvate sulfurtransferase SseA